MWSCEKTREWGRSLSNTSMPCSLDPSYIYFNERPSRLSANSSGASIVIRFHRSVRSVSPASRVGRGDASRGSASGRRGEQRARDQMVDRVHAVAEAARTDPREYGKVVSRQGQRQRAADRAAGEGHVLSEILPGMGQATVVAELAHYVELLARVRGAVCYRRRRSGGRSSTKV